MMLLLSTLLLLNSVSAYTLQSSWQGQDLLDNFNFEPQSGGDNGGIANYLSEEAARSSGLAQVSYHSSVVRLYTSSTGQQSPRDSVKIVSKASYNSGLFVFDIHSVPSAMGLWPALWLTSTTGTWPDSGEIDVIEGVHETTMNAMSSHTSHGCVQQTNGFSGEFMMNTWDKNVCAAHETNNQGCGVRDSDKTSFGGAFNAKRGGVYAVKWDAGGIATYHFDRMNIPRDIVAGQPNPDNWGTPRNFLSSNSCSIKDHFKDLSIIINTNVCGSWPEGTWSQDMGYAGQSGSAAQKTGYSSCQDYAANQGSAFNGQHWQINSIKVYQ